MNIRTATLLLLVCTLFACCVQSHNSNQTVLHTNLSGNSQVQNGAIDSPHFVSEYGRKYRARVVRVVDGDTINTNFSILEYNTLKNKSSILNYNNYL